MPAIEELGGDIDFNAMARPSSLDFMDEELQGSMAMQSASIRSAVAERMQRGLELARTKKRRVRETLKVTPIWDINDMLAQEFEECAPQPVKLPKVVKKRLREEALAAEIAELEAAGLDAREIMAERHRQSPEGKRQAKLAERRQRKLLRKQQKKEAEEARKRLKELGVAPELSPEHKAMLDSAFMTQHLEANAEEHAEAVGVPPPKVQDEVKLALMGKTPQYEKKAPGKAKDATAAYPLPVIEPEKVGDTMPTRMYQLPVREGIDREFIDFYCARYGLPSPIIKCDELKPKRKKKGKKHKHDTELQLGWKASLDMPEHTRPDRTAPVRGLRFTAQQFRLQFAREECERGFASLLVNECDKTFIDFFLAHSAPFKDRLQNVLQRPLTVRINETVLEATERTLEQCRLADAFSGTAPESDLLFLDPAVLPTTTASPATTLSSATKPAASAPSMTTTTPVATEQDSPQTTTIPPYINTSMPIASRYVELLNTISKSQVTIIAAETGAGKTTQLPQYIMAEHKELGGTPPSLLITQPRRIAAISIAERVAHERGERVGVNSAIGYAVRFDSRRPTTGPDQASAVFVTTGVLLRRLRVDPTLQGVTHVVLDEVHERDLNTDLAMIALRDLLPKRPDLRLVLMSATADIDLFRSYFGGNVPVVSVKGRMFPVKEFHLEDCLAMLRKVPQYADFLANSAETERWVSAELDDQTHTRDLPADLIEVLVTHVTQTLDNDLSILVFLPGWAEISALQRRLRGDRFQLGLSDESRFHIYTLHSSMPQQTQQSVFDKPAPGQRKIILSTNIAETSVTVRTPCRARSSCCHPGLTCVCSVLD